MKSHLKTSWILSRWQRSYLFSLTFSSALFSGEKPCFLLEWWKGPLQCWQCFRVFMKQHKTHFLTPPTTKIQTLNLLASPAFLYTLPCQVICSPWPNVTQNHLSLLAGRDDLFCALAFRTTWQMWQDNVFW